MSAADLELINQESQKIEFQLNSLPVYDLWCFTDNELSALQRVSYEGFNQIMFTDLPLINQEKQNLVSETEDSIEICKALATTAEVNACNGALLPILDEMISDILNRVVEISEVGHNLLQAADEEMNNLVVNNRQLATETTQTLSVKLTTCIENLQLFFFLLIIKFIV